METRYLRCSCLIYQTMPDESGDYAKLNIRYAPQFEEQRDNLNAFQLVNN